MKVLDGPMNIELEPGDLRILCEAASGNPELSREQRELVTDICYLMIWDDIKLPDPEE